LSPSRPPRPAPSFTGGYVMRAADGGFEDEGLHNEATTAEASHWDPSRHIHPTPYPPCEGRNSEAPNRGGARCAPARDHDRRTGAPGWRTCWATWNARCFLCSALQLETLNHLRVRRTRTPWTEQTANRRAVSPLSKGGRGRVG
jgi:hypothetical protein